MLLALNDGVSFDEIDEEIEMAKHHLTHASGLYYGSAYHVGASNANGRSGVPLHPMTKLPLGSPVALDADGYAASQDGTGWDGTAAMTLAGALAGVADVARNVTITSAGDDSGITFSVTGTDHYDEAVVETITGANTGAAAGAKAFKAVTQILPSAASAANVTAGTGDVIGLTYRAEAKADVLRVFFGDALDDSATVVAGVDTTPSAITGDVRGTVDPDSACDGSALVAWVHVDPETRSSMVGKVQYSG